MEVDIIKLLLLGIVIIGEIGVIFYLLARSLPQATAAHEALEGTLLQFIPILRRIFDPDTYLAKALKRKGLSPEIADAVAEWGADQLEALIRPALPEEAAPRGG